MINSLLKDSHITRPSRFKKTPSENSNVPKRELKCAATRMMNSSDIIVKKPAEPSFSGFLSAEKLAKKTWFNKMLTVAGENPVLFSNGVALVLTCLFRPITICALPGKKNKDDKRYAAASSIASGIIGFVGAVLFANPISAAVKKVMKNPTLYVPKNVNKLKALDKTASVYVNQLPDILISSPKAIITIAILPPILKYVFGLEKKKHNKMQPVEEYPLLNFKSAALGQRKSLQSFMGGRK